MKKAIDEFVEAFYECFIDLCDWIEQRLLSLKVFFVGYWEWVKHDMFDFKVLCIRNAICDSNNPLRSWCSPEYMSYKTGIDLSECQVFLLGPDNNKDCGLWLYKKQRDKMNSVDLTKYGESNDGQYLVILSEKETRALAKAARDVAAVNGCVDTTQAHKMLKNPMMPTGRVLRSKDPRVFDDENPYKGNSVS